MPMKLRAAQRAAALLHPGWLLPLLSIPALWTFALHGLPQTHDGGLHLMRLTLLDYHLRNGILYARWIPELLLGQGYPLFNFYAPATYYIAEVFHLAGMGLQQALSATFILLVWLGGWGAYLLAHDLYQTRQRGPALAAAVAYIYAPYLLTNVFVRGAIAEVGAQALLPWIFWGARRTMLHAMPDRHAVVLALSLALLALTHNITLLLTPPVLVLYLIYLWPQSGFSRERFGWATTGLLLAMGLSAFFWLPMLAERVFLAETAFDFARAYMSEHVWRWHNFLDRTFVFTYDGIVPFQIGLLQVLTAITGFVLARRNSEWWFWLGVTLASILLIWHWSLPLWLNVELMQVAQFPWRLVTLLTLPLALFCGGILLRLESRPMQIGGLGTLVALLIVTQYPRLAWVDVRPVYDGTNLSAIAQLEAGASWLGSGHSREFWPAWSEDAATLDADVLPDGDFAVTTERASAYEIVATVSSAEGGALRFNNYFFPTWRVTVDGEELAHPYPSTSLGLVTVDVPPGDHEIHLFQANTTLQRIASWITLGTLAGFGIVLAWRARGRGARGHGYRQAAAPFTLILLYTGFALSRPNLADVQTPLSPVGSEQVALTGYRTEIDGRFLRIYPYWYVHRRPAEDLMVHWQLQDSAGEVINEITSRPWYYGTFADLWAPGTLIDDAYRLALPMADTTQPYTLTAQLIEDDAAVSGPPATVGTVTVPPVRADEPLPQHDYAVQFADQVALLGYDLAICGPPERPCNVCSGPQCATVGQPAFANRSATVAKPGDTLSYTFYWQALTSLARNYHSFIHLVDVTGTPMVQDDQLAGTFAYPSRTWDRLMLQPDLYRLAIPADMPNGLVQPKLGVYYPLQEIHNFTEVERLAIDDGSENPPNATGLPPLKIFGRTPPAPLLNRTDYHFDDLADVIGYDVQMPSAIKAGDAFTVTLQYEAAPQIGQCEGPETACAQRYIRTVQLYHPELGMAAQQDGEPQAGNNPTWSWLPGEVVQETVPLIIAADATPGDYTLYVGFYTPEDGVRLATTDGQGDALPNQLVPLTVIQVE
ncbi:MAG: hypothetical protein KDD84_13270 [Caldilineaceae bacterium]|nr:hypothetical protein [Caldilineaceae bacterium]